MAAINTLKIDPPLVNTACAWVSEYEQLKACFECPYTGAVTTRTAAGVDEGYPRLAGVHGVAFSKTSITSINTYAYSPHPLSAYLSWIKQILDEHPTSTKPFIVSVTTTEPAVLRAMINAIQAFRTTLPDPARIAIELNTSCPNVKAGAPPAYHFPTCRSAEEYLASPLGQLIAIFADARKADPGLTVGLKLPPYVHAGQFSAFLDGLALFTIDGTQPPVSFFTCTNTLGNTLMPASMLEGWQGEGMEGKDMLGGAGGEAIHALALGNVAAFARLLTERDVLREIKIIGAGGVTTPDAVKRMHDAGATVVGSATLFGKLGPDAAFALLSGR
ncbi:FMN-linked oxidoreductase [Schizophyllum commune H4-8]|uniref:Dihydroorotate oxidase n=1 Tax=Schizophyllum commune (strain H4-8 / FGSC 9210) TaxID=578458 RepID=D8QKJ0_SCHCM|nr:FMN-linked oxidoreductase [Schizophyllum commune H4-8]KAI5885133.1 FMN-linked oxidoreductase [Schizophyllum commune H4-8]